MRYPRFGMRENGFDMRLIEFGVRENGFDLRLDAVWYAPRGVSTPYARRMSNIGGIQEQRGLKRQSKAVSRPPHSKGTIA
jgi:hypothetical protein